MPQMYEQTNGRNVANVICTGFEIEKTTEQCGLWIKLQRFARVLDSAQQPSPQLALKLVAWFKITNVEHKTVRHASQT